MQTFCVIEKKKEKASATDCLNADEDPLMQTPHDLVTDMWTHEHRGLPVGDHAMVCNNVRGTASPTHVYTEVTVL